MQEGIDAGDGVTIRSKKLCFYEYLWETTLFGKPRLLGTVVALHVLVCSGEAYVRSDPWAPDFFLSLLRVLP